jgi:hypothetical protein
MPKYNILKRKPRTINLFGGRKTYLPESKKLNDYCKQLALERQAAYDARREMPSDVNETIFDHDFGPIAEYDFDPQEGKSSIN